MGFERMRQVFLELLRVDSPSLDEKKAADVIKDFLDRQGIPWEEDNTAEVTGAACGNIITAGPGKARLSFCAHMDTIRIYEPGFFVEEGDIIRGASRNEDAVQTNNGALGEIPDGAVIGVDDKCGVAVQLEVMALLAENGGIPGDIHFLFTTCEEDGFRGAKALDERHFIDALNFINDSGGLPIGRCVNQGVGQFSFRIDIAGRMSHTGGTRGKNAALFAAGLLTALETGRLSETLFFNVSALDIPGNPNTIPDRGKISGQVLYYNQDEAEELLENMKKKVFLLAEAEGFGCRVSVTQDCLPLNTPEDAPIVALARRAAEKAGLEFCLGKTGSGSDAHMLAQRGGQVLKISSGMMNVHSKEEYADLREMYKCVRFVCALASPELLDRF